MWGAGIIVVLGAVSVWGYISFTNHAPKEYVVETPTGQATTNTISGETTTGVKTFTRADVASHKDATSCYTSINGSVYDLTLWVNVHPGGKAKILSICGMDGTQKFMAKHHGNKKQMNILSRFKIGTLAS